MTSARLLLALFAVAFLTGCSNPEKEKVDHVRKGDQYVAEKKDEFAVVEYASAIKIDPKYGDAHWKLAQAYERAGNARAAFPAFIRAADALPDNRDAQVKAIEVLIVSLRFEDAKARATALLAKNPRDVELRVLQATALGGLNDGTGALAQIDEAVKIDPRSSRAMAMRGSIQLQLGQPKEAEAAFRRAVELDPDSVGTRLALVNFLKGVGRATDAEALLKGTLTKEPNHLAANQMLADLYLATRRAAEAEQPLKTIAGASKDPMSKLRLADYYTEVGRTNEARELLTALSSGPTTFVDAELRLARIEHGQRQSAEAHKRLDALLVRAPNNAAALTTKAEWLISENRMDEALKFATAAVVAAPQSAVAHFALATVHEQRGDVGAAIKSYNEVTRLNPRADRAMTALSRLNLNRDRTLALRQAEEARQTAPSNNNARVALVRSLIAARNFARADTEMSRLLAIAPGNAGVHALQGTLDAARGNSGSARESFERALALSPGLFEALNGLTYLDLQAKLPAQATARLEAAVSKQGSSPRLVALLAQAYVASGDQAKAEQALRRAVSIDPRFTAGYEQLAQMFVRQGKLEQARLEFEGIARRDPTAIGAKTFVGILLDMQGRHDDARKWYEELVKGTDDAPVAANNLAFIYADQGANLDIALQLATSAKPKLPDDPNVDDTIGWVYYKKGLHSLAVGPLEASAKKMPRNADVLYHLGLTYAALGAKVKARDTLNLAISINPKVGGEQARRTLAAVSQ